jgi:hypothetical protein
VRAITVIPGEPGSAELREVPDPRPGPGDLLVETIALGVATRRTSSAVGPSAAREEEREDDSRGDGTDRRLSARELTLAARRRSRI